MTQTATAHTAQALRLIAESDTQTLVAFLANEHGDRRNARFVALVKDELASR